MMNPQRQIIQIVPKLPPAIDGLGDYALNIARQLYKDFGVRTHFVVGDPAWVGAEEIEGCPVSKVKTRSASNLLALLLNVNAPPRVVLLHYVGYGYAKRGCPFWLVKGLENWKRNTNNAQLVTMFHELYAFGPPWTSSFWLSVFQRNLVERLVQLSDHCVTSNDGYAAKLHSMELLVNNRSRLYK